MICPKCKNTMNDNYNFCTVCGTKLYSKKAYSLPPLALLPRGKRSATISDEYLHKLAYSLEALFTYYDVGAHVVNITCGPRIIRYEIQPEQGVSVRRILALFNDIKMLLHVENINIEAPIPGRAAVGISFPAPTPSTIALREILESTEFIESPSTLSFAVGKDLLGNNIVATINEMPHLLIGGTTGSGKSTFIHSIILSILYKSTPAETKFILIDTKAVELNIYNGIPHLLIPVITNPQKAGNALAWVTKEMERRYQLLAESSEKNIDSLNKKERNTATESSIPKIIILIDGLSDIIDNHKNVEEHIARLTQNARAVGIYLIITASFPCTRCVSSLIKSNLLSRISFHTASKSDSRIILGQSGAEELLPTGDMLFYPSGYPNPIRIQTPFISDKEIQNVVDYLYAQNNFTENI